MRTLLLPLLWMPTLAHAFCGTYVGSPGVELINHTSQVILARQDGQTTLTLANDVEGDVTEFGLVIPVPAVLTAEDVRTVEPELFTAFDAWSAPRLVSYSCQDYAWEEGDSDTDTDSDSDTDTDGTAGSVTVESEFSAGAYDIVVLSADDAGALLAWLDQNGFQAPLEAEVILDELIAGGSYLLAAKVSLDAAATAPAYLSPLQLAYASETFSLPIRIGTANSMGEQDLILYTLTDPNGGGVKVANYPEFTVEDECMVEMPEGFAAYYADAFRTAWEGAPKSAAWMTEYSWTTHWCDPCASDPPSPEQLADAGWSDDGAHFTRLHLRMTPDAVDQDLVLYASNQDELSQVRFIQYNPLLESVHPVCGVGRLEDVGEECDFGGEDDTGDDDTDDSDEEEDSGGADSGEDEGSGLRLVGGGCGVPVGHHGALGAAVFALLWTRRRR